MLRCSPAPTLAEGSNVLAEVDGAAAPAPAAGEEGEATPAPEPVEEEPEDLSQTFDQYLALKAEKRVVRADTRACISCLHPHKQPCFHGFTHSYTHSYTHASRVHHGAARDGVACVCERRVMASRSSRPPRWTSPPSPRPSAWT